MYNSNHEQARDGMKPYTTTPSGMYSLYLYLMQSLNSAVIYPFITKIVSSPISVCLKMIYQIKKLYLPCFQITDLLFSRDSLGRGCHFLEQGDPLVQ